MRVTDNGTPAKSDAKSFKVTVNESGSSPVLAVIPDKVVDELTTSRFTASATDASLPPDTLTFSLDPGAPGRRSDRRQDRRFSWTPTEAQGPGTYTITVRVADNGTPAKSDTKSFKVTVNEVNVAPVLAIIPDKSADELTTLSFAASATDADLPTNALTYSLDPGFPPGASIDGETGVFSWTPTEAQGPGTYTITVRATDDGSPPKRRLPVVQRDRSGGEPSPAARGHLRSVDPGGADALGGRDRDRPGSPREWAPVLARPRGAVGVTIDPTTGVLLWPTSRSQPADTYAVRVRVIDDGTPPRRTPGPSSSMSIPP